MSAAPVTSRTDRAEDLAFAMLAVHALNQLDEHHPDDQRCCAKCCAPCHALTTLEKHGTLDEVIAPFLAQGGSGYSWQLDTGHVDRRWLAAHIAPWCDLCMPSLIGDEN
jgi:hypothetical protein